MSILMEEVLNLNSTKSQDNIVTGFYTTVQSISVICCLLTIVIYSLNVKQFTAIENKIHHPLRKFRACMIVQSATFLVIRQLLELLLINCKFSLTTKITLGYWLHIFSIFFSLLFYAWCTSVHVLMFYLTKHLFTAFDVLNQKFLFVVSYGIPLVGFILYLALTNPNDDNNSQNTFSFIKQPFWKWIIFSMRAMYMIVIATINVYVTIKHVQSVKTFVKTTKGLLLQLKKRKKLTNSSTITTNLMILFIFDCVILFCGIKLSSNSVFIYVVILFHATLGPFFLIFEAVLYDKDLLKPFRWQQRKETIKEVAILQMERNWRRKSVQGMGIKE